MGYHFKFLEQTCAKLSSYKWSIRDQNYCFLPQITVNSAADQTAVRSEHLSLQVTLSFIVYANLNFQHNDCSTSGEALLRSLRSQSVLCFTPGCIEGCWQKDCRQCLL